MVTSPFRLGLTLSTAILLGASVAAQESRPKPHVAPSGRVTTSVTFDGRVTRGGGWFPGTPSHSGPSRITIDYGQPHARGRTIFGGLVPYDEVWRVGANWATRLTLDLDVRIGDLDVPRGEYTLFLLPRETGAELIVSLETRQWGTDYDPSRDFERASMSRRVLAEAAPSMAITLEPNLGGENEEVPSGTLRITWGTVEYFANWQILWP
ncbi:MAG: DUF2911 domain-containing protein [Acidobacteriota bacterium]|nr:DUF2911 domain-containing protein [Acidobacteriota bacterium]